MSYDPSRAGSGLRLYRGPDLRSRVTRFGQGLAFKAPNILSAKMLAPAPVAPKPAVTLKPVTTTTPFKPFVLPPTIAINTPSLPGLPGFHITLPTAPTQPPPTITMTPALPPLTGSSPGVPLTGGPSTPSSGGAPPTSLGPSNVPPISDGSPAPQPTSTDGGGGGISAAPVLSAAAPAAGFPLNTLLFLALGAVGVYLLATSHH